MVFIGMNTPQMKTITIRTTVAGGMAPGMSQKGAERSNPKTENINEENNIPKKNGSRLGNGEKGNMIIVYTRERNVPKKKPAMDLPSIIVNNDVGAVRSILNVPVLLSNGRDTAWIAPAPKKADIATNPGNTKVGSTVLLIENAK
jgi:hypothetical protein